MAADRSAQQSTDRMSDSTAHDGDVEKEPQANGDVEKKAEAPAAAAPSGPPQQPPKDPNVIGFEDIDPSLNPMNWSKSFKWVTTAILTLLTFAITFTSAMFSTASIVTAEEYGVGPTVTVLGTSLYVLGFAFGPIIFGPMSELFGRKTPLLIGVFGMSTFQIGVAVAQNLYTIMLCRFFAGTFGSAPLAVIGGCLADFWTPVERGIAFGAFSSATFVGPVLAPVMGGFITPSYLGWRWTEWITVILGYFCFALGLLFLPESYGALILSRQAKKMRIETKNWALRAPADEKEVNAKVIFTAYLFRPFRMIFLEPILILVTLYMGLVYGILYLFLEAFPVSFGEQRGWNEGVSALPFLSIMLGVFGAGLYLSIYARVVYAPKIQKTGGKVIPEDRLPPMAIGGAAFTIGLFWWAWSSFPGVHKLWVSQLFAGIPIGFGINVIFVQGLSYIIDCYKWHANSAISASTFFRSLLGAGFPLFATAMYHKLGVPWATSLLAFLTLALFPVPILFRVYGRRIRDWSNYAPKLGF